MSQAKKAARKEKQANLFGVEKKSMIQEKNVEVGAYIMDRDFHKNYEIQDIVICRGDFFEVREAIVRKTLEKKSVKIYRLTETYSVVERNEEGLEVTAWKVRPISDEILATIEREVRLFSALDHPNIIRIHEAMRDDFKIYMVFDNCVGKTMFDRIITQGCMSEKEAAAIAAYLVSILRYLHSKGIILRNLRPECILFE